ncbi:MAG: hypothetical protein MOB07_06030 [Acidobacteria bacterium]|nr:hypothetical protein [Acidobacteriota bacterium]
MIKTPADTQHEEQLKKTLMPLILGEGNFVVVQHEGTDYYCAARETWEAAGIIPRIRG